MQSKNTNIFRTIIQKIIKIFIITFLITSYLFFAYSYFQQRKILISSSQSTINGNQYDEKSLEKVTRIIDGDTFEIEGGIKVRLIGVNTPEMNGGKTKIECFAKEATEELTRLLQDKRVRLEKDVSETDKYGRLLRYTYLDDVFINDLLVRDGYAQVATYPPDVKYLEIFLKSQKYAKENNFGLWLKCQTNK